MFRYVVGESNQVTLTQTCVFVLCRQLQLQGAAQQASDAHSHLGQLQQQMDQLAAAARQAEAGADAAAGEQCDRCCMHQAALLLRWCCP